MSGSGGGGYEPPQRTKFNCDTSTIITDISSIDIKVLNKHIVGDILEVLLGNNDNLILEDRNGEILGSILHLNTSDIIECIKNGATYSATITIINTPSCKVKIQRV